MFGNVMPVFAAMDGIQATNGKQRQNGLDEFPDENPTDKGLTDWLDANEPVVVSMFGAALRGEIPTHFKPFAGVDDLTGFDEFTGPVTGMRADQIVSHNMKVRKQGLRMNVETLLRQTVLTLNLNNC